MRKFYFVFILVMCGSFIGLVSPVLAAGSPNSQPVRALQIVIRAVSVADVERLTDMAKASGFNSIILDLRDGVKFNSFPGKALPNAWTREELLAVVEHARLQGLSIIPEVQLLTHQEQLFGDSHPSLMFNQFTYNPAKSEVYDLVFPYLDEIITLLHPASFLIGHDEVAGIFNGNEASKKRGLRGGEEPLPADLFLQDVERTHAYLKKKGVETWMYGDALISHEEFPNMSIIDGSMGGGSLGYGKELRSRMPKDIVIYDWHYGNSGHSEYPTLAAFRADGFQVLGATFEDKKTISDFSRYAYNHGARGMVATLWYHVQKKEWDVVDRIIRDSGEAFSKDFPDAK